MADIVHATGARRARRAASLRGRSRVRILPAIAVAMAAALILLWPARTTMASWSDSASASPGSFTHGTLDMVWNGNTTDQIGLGDWGLAGMYPGDSRAVTVTVANTSLESAMSYVVYARATNPNLAPSLTLQLFLNGTATNSGTSAAGYSGTCTGTSLGPATAIGTGDVLVGTAAGPFAAGSSHTLCVRAVFASSAPVAAQGQSSQITLTSTAKQLER